jgi:hypothetical protein
MADKRIEEDDYVRSVASPSSSRRSSAEEGAANNGASTEATLDTTTAAVDALQDKLKRVTRHLREIQELSPKCEEVATQENARERQVKYV